MQCIRCCRCGKGAQADASDGSESEAESSVDEEIQEEIRNHEQEWDSLFFPMDALCGICPREEEEEETELEVLFGTWRCVDTWGLEDFLKANRVGLIQRKVALAAKWPNWDFHRSEQGVRFVNHSMLGDLVEEVNLQEEYVSRDGHGNLLRCQAEWVQISTGGMLRTKKTGEIGEWTEERSVTGDKLEFVLRQSNGAQWGRSFVRETPAML
ncbi:Phenylalanyl-tRNA synthetase beta subunit [Durusdinium trenchii]